MLTALFVADNLIKGDVYKRQQLERITLPNKDVDFLREKLLLMYANPLTNYLAATK